MSEIAIPEIECVESEDKFGRFVAEPLEKGFGTTLGNALRRVMLRYLPGVAVTWISIEGVQHEFSSIPHIKEDVIEFLLNIKALRLKSLTGRSGSLRLEVTGEKIVCASDIAPSADFEIANPEIYLATLDSPEARLHMEFGVELGRGYRLAESSGSLPVGTIPLDAIFSPIRKVNFTTEPIHVGKETSRERLYLEVWTDGSISPADAVSQAADVLVRQLQPFATYSGVIPIEEELKAVSPAVPDEKYDISVEQLDLSVRTMNCLRHAGISTVGEVISKGEKELMELHNFGQKSLTELKELFGAMGLSLAVEEEPPSEPKKRSKKKALAAAPPGDSGEQD